MAVHSLPIALVALAALLPAVAAAQPSCADPAIVSAISSTAGTTGALNDYDVAIVVRNRGNLSQASSLLESVEIYQDGTKVEQKSISPLAAGASQTVHYRLERSTDARPGSTLLRFVVVQHDAHGRAVTDCTTANNTYRLAL